MWEGYMKKWVFMFVSVVLLMLSACKDSDEKTYLYRYAVTKDNYDVFFDVEHDDQTVDDVKSIITTFSLLDKNDLAEDIEIEMKVTLHDLFVSYYSPKTKNYTIKFDNKTSFEHKMTYGITEGYEKAEFTSFTGIIHTNTEHDFPSIPTDSESDTNYTKLMDDLSSLDTYESLTVNGLIKIKQYNQTSYTRITMVMDSTDFYVESLINNDTGYIVYEIDGYYYMYEIFRYEYHNYKRLVAIYDDIQDEWEDTSSSTEFSQSWEYTYFEGVYTVKASFESLFEIALGDEDLLGDLLSNMPDEDLIMTIDLRDEDAIKFEITFEIEDVEVDIEMTYVPNIAERIDLSGHTELPAVSPELLMDYTDVAELQEDHIYDGIHPNYYLVNLEQGVYSIELPELMDIKIYDEIGDKVNLVKNPGYAFQNYYQNIYDIDSGEYLIELSSRADQVIVYDFQMAKLDDLYETIVDQNNPEVLTVGTYQLEIEGTRDIVVATFHAPSGGMLVLKPNVQFEGILEIIPPSGYFNHYTLIKQNNDMYLHLEKGTTTFIFLNRLKEESVTFDVSHYGTTQTTVSPLPANYPKDFIISTSTQGMRYSFTLTEESVMHFESIIDPNAPYKNYGINYQLDKLNGSIPISFTSFSMTTHHQVYLPAGSYILRAEGVTSVKIRGHAQAATALEDITIFPDELTSISAFETDSISYMKSFFHYPGKELNILFTLDQMEDVLIAFNWDLEYVLYDNQNKVINFSQLNGHQIFRLPAGSYRIYLPILELGQVYEYKAAINIVHDELVQNDDFIYNYKDPVKLDLDTLYQFDKEFKTDHELITFTLTEAKEIDLVVGQMAFVVLYDSYHQHIKSFYDTTTLNLAPGTYYVVFLYMSTSQPGTKIDFMVRTT